MRSFTHRYFLNTTYFLFIFEVSNKSLMKKLLLLSLLLISIPSFINAQVDLKNGLVAFYKLDGNAIDSSINSLNGTVNGASNDSGHLGKPTTALKFNGSSNYVDVAHNSKFNLSKDKSVSLWYKIPVKTGFTQFPSLVYKQGVTDYPTFGIFFSEDAGYGSNRYKIGFIQGNSTTNKQVFTNERYTDYVNEWVHIAATYSSTEDYMKIYFNGKLSDSLSVINYTSNTSTDPLQIGRGNKLNFNANYFKGLLDEVRLYDRALNKEEVVTLYNEREYLYKNNTITICQPDSVLAGGAYRHTSGIYYDTINIAAKCDSVIITELTVTPSYYFPVTLTICDGNKILIAGQLRTKAGVYYDSLKTNKGCDSVIQVNLLVNPSYYTTNTLQICQGASTVLGGVLRNTSGTYYDSLLTTKGCDSIIETTLIINPKYLINQTKQICDGESILLGGSLQTTGGIYYDSLKTTSSCDSVIVTTLIVNPTYTSNQNRTICQGDSILLGGSFQTTAGAYTDVLYTSKGCDSTIVTQLTVNPSYMVQDARTICQGDSTFIAGSYRYTAGVYYNNLTTTKGCDSIIATTLIVNPSYIIPFAVTICNGDSALVNGIYRKTAGIYYDSATSAKGCDSITITNLQVTTNSNSIIQNANVLVAQEGNATYQWLDCNNNNAQIAGETSQLFVATANGDYAVRVTKNSCTVTSSCVSVISLSDNRSHTFKQSLKVYPNPAKNWVKVELGKVYSKATVTIYTIEGKRINTSTIVNSNNVELSTSEISAGTYLIEVVADGNRAFSKIVIEN